METINELLATRKSQEERLQQLQNILTAEGNVGLTGSLIDSEGFPRGDIDIYKVRHARNEAIRLRNDHIATSKQIELFLKSQPKQTTKVEEKLVDGVAPDSPASLAGLVRGDQIIQFANINSLSQEPLQAIAKIAAANENVSLDLIVSRDDKKITLNITPQVWSGRGLIGCHIVPL